MVKRVTIDATAASPFRVSAAGVDTDVAEFLNVIFDGNQPPLRLHSTGYQLLTGISYNEFQGGQNAREGSPTLVAASPTGTVPIFVVSVVTYNAGSNLPSTPFRLNVGTDGAGGAVCRNSGNNYFIPITFGKVGPPGTPDVGGGGALVNYLVFKNWT